MSIYLDFNYQSMAEFGNLMGSDEDSNEDIGINESIYILINI